MPDIPPLTAIVPVPKPVKPKRDDRQPNNRSRTKTPDPHQPSKSSQHIDEIV